MPDDNKAPSGDKDMRLDAIVDYSMDELESKAYKLTLLWLEQSRRVFPDYNHAKMAAKGDPRKSMIFKQCYKLVRETIGILEEREYSLYIRAQLEILKYISKSRPKSHCMIGPNCLCGEKAWVRWKLWKRKYDAVSKVNDDKAPVPANVLKVADTLTKTKEFLVKTFGADIGLQKYQEAATNKNWQRWISTGKVSPYYIVLSPLLEKVFPDGIKDMTMDLNVFREIITPDIREFFRKTFPNEFI